MDAGSGVEDGRGRRRGVGEAATKAVIEMVGKDGIEMCVKAAVVLAGAMKRVEHGTDDGAEKIVGINAGAGAKTSDSLGRATRRVLRPE